jgi:isoleucyl-tRNA synthetase
VVNARYARWKEPKMATFDPVASRVAFPELEASILDFWRDHKIFQRSVDERPADNIFSFYEGPPTANGNPGIHHVLARAFKDVVPRYRTMRGYRVPRKGGWDTHGLPVELEVERELGLTTKREIEAYGVEAFNQKCRESVMRYVNEWEQMTDRIGFWIDTDDAYITYSNEYVETGWWIFKRLWDNDLVFQDFRVTPHCPRCQTSLSSHEIAQGYEEDTPDPGVTLRFRLPAGAAAPASLSLEDGVPTSLLAWTTTPWTLSGNTALAVRPSAEYALVEVAREDEAPERVVLANALVASVVGEEGTVLGTLPGTDLISLEYEALYPQSVEWVEPLAFIEGRAQRLKDADPLPARRVIASDEVTTDEGTGILHVAPAFGEADYVMGRTEGLMFLQPVQSNGTMIGGPGDGLFAKEADPVISEDLRQRGLLFKAETIRHTYPFCWRCGTPVLYYAKPSWYIRTTAVADKLIEHNQQINWVPENIKNGRFGEWLEGNVDWAVSRERYWGTPLPLWVCEICEHVDCVGSYEELRARARPGTADSLETDHGFDPHRPYVDRVQLDCSRCNGTMRRTPEVADGWFDSGAMPYAQWHYPFENREVFDERFPADFICEAVDQTRGWFYTLHALATLLHRTEDVPEGIAYRNVISLGHILDGDGQKMSKSKGNVVDPWTVLDHHGADATRWYMYTASPPGNARRFSEDLVAETTRRFLSTLWNTYSFFVTYANLADFDPAALAGPEEEPSELDRWVRSELHRTVQRVTEGLEAYELSDAARPIEQFVDELSNWYVRRSRRRFWRSGDDADSRVALRTLYECLVTVSRLLAPFTPFVAESLHRNLVATRVDGAADSVHLESWPEIDEAAIDATLSEEMAVVQRMVSLGRAARSSAQVRVRQPLGTAALLPRTEAERSALERLASLVADELNVKAVEVLDDAGDRVSYTLRPNLPVLGPKFGREVGKIRGALEAADAAPIVRAMRAGEAIQLGEFELGGGDILVGVEAAEGWATAEDSGYVALLDTTITAELRSEGLARELVRRLQDLRREADLEVSDRIEVRYAASDAPEVGRAFAEHGAYIAEETLALSIEAGEAPTGWASTDATIDGLKVTLALRRAEMPA